MRSRPPQRGPPAYFASCRLRRQYSNLTPLSPSSSLSPPSSSLPLPLPVLFSFLSLSLSSLTSRFFFSLPLSLCSSLLPSSSRLSLSPLSAPSSLSSLSSLSLLSRARLSHSLVALFPLPLPILVARLFFPCSSTPAGQEATVPQWRGRPPKGKGGHPRPTLSMTPMTKRSFPNSAKSPSMRKRTFLKSRTDH